MTIFNWIDQILVNKKSWEKFDESDHKTFSPFIINRWLSMDVDFLEIVNFFQKYSIGLLKPKEVYKWYCDVLPKGKRFNKYIKGKKQVKYNNDLIEITCKHFETSKKECMEYIELMNKEQLTSLLELFGKNKKEIKTLLKGKK
ncbi:MAG: DNA polymerase clamp loader subunit A [Candidatus Pelagibacter sp.]|nr:DNA polymerase clamp loader subunit A [Candidatus Pelagibacter sp.]